MGPRPGGGLIPNSCGDPAMVTIPRPRQAGQTVPVVMTEIASWPFEKRLEVTIERAKLGPEVRAQLQALVSAESLEIMAGVLVAWVVSHVFGVGEVIDAMILAVGVVAIGFSIFSGLDHLYLFATGAYYAQSDPDFDKAADHFAKAIAILGLQAVLVLFKGRPYGKREYVGTPPPMNYGPTLTWTKKLPATFGQTDPWGISWYHRRAAQHLGYGVYFTSRCTDGSCLS